MLLGLEERVKVPERALYPLIRRHLFEAHQQKDASDLCLNLHKRVQAAARTPRTARAGKVEALEVKLLPRPLEDHVGGEVCQSLACCSGELLGLAHAVSCDARRRNQLPLLQSLDPVLAEGVQGPQVGLGFVRNGVAGKAECLGLLVQGDPAVLHCNANSHLAHVAQRSVDGIFGHRPLGLDKIEDLHLRAASLAVLLALGRQLPALALRGLRGDPLVGQQGLQNSHEVLVVPTLLIRQSGGVRDLSTLLKQEHECVLHWTGHSTTLRDRRCLVGSVHEKLGPKLA
mmetsp:Transcript_124855/g.364655  ORF Transcript_124855/g.364655 Transcript_124855/m.364655 type:complete len:286 (+) Transcript_124855:784-1641(+)